MGRRSRARRLNKRTAVSDRSERMHIKTWLLKPDQKVTRIEAYTLVREYYYAEKRRRILSNPILKIGLAVWLIITAPIRVPLKLWRRRQERLDQEEADSESAENPDQEEGGARDSEVVR